MRRLTHARTIAAVGIAAGILPVQRVAAHGNSTPQPVLPGVLATWSTDPLPFIGVALAAAGYLAAVRRVNRRHPDSPVPGRRAAAWLSGLLAILLALSSAVDVYADQLLTVHMVQHLLLSMVAPPLLALGAPITLLLRVASPGPRRRWILPVLHSRAARVITSPWVTWPTFAIVLWAAHFTPLYDAALESPALHMAEHILFLAAGMLFWWPAVAADPVPRRMSHGARFAYLLLQMPVGAGIGLALYFAPGVLYAHYATVVRGWGPSPLVDQQVGGLLMWAAGGVVMLAALAALVADWMRADVRRSERADLQAVPAARPGRR